MAYVPDPSRTLYAACVSPLDSIFLDGWGDAAYVTQTSQNVTELMRVDPATRSMYAVVAITWPSSRGQEPIITGLDLRRHPPGVIPPLRQIDAHLHKSTWFHTVTTVGKDVYERYTVSAANTMQRSHVTRRRKQTPLSTGLSIIGLDSIRGTKEQTLEIRLLRDGYLRDDTDIVLAAILLLSGTRDWKVIQSTLTKDQLESCIAVSRLKRNQKWDEESDHHHEDDPLA